ncbi:endo alpha-1,4 polygalactosaminidase [Tolypothrix campylonemoides VB511288]|nr:endo alpha-1,4 polygalactosaminidase [Tolypothrix campylonemoides VB511288]
MLLSKLDKYEGKAVFAAEYTDEMNSTTFTPRVCNQAQQMKFSAILLNRNLDGKPVAKYS